MPLYKVHLPLKNGYALVTVDTEKTYNGVSGFDLVKKYARRPRPQPELKPLRVEENLIFIPSKLPDQIIIKDQVFKTRDFFNQLEQGLGINIISKRELRPLRNFQNVTLRIW